MCIPGKQLPRSLATSLAHFLSQLAIRQQNGKMVFQGADITHIELKTCYAFRDGVV